MKKLRPYKMYPHHKDMRAIMKASREQMKARMDVFEVKWDKIEATGKA
jgi:predicted aspartyl protease